MAVSKYIYHLTPCVTFYLLFQGLYAQEEVDAKCKKPWYISLSEDVAVSWTGDDRDAVVAANITTPDSYGRNCDFNQSLVAEFRDRNVKLRNPCSNAFYTVTVTLICGKVRQQQNMTKRTPPDAPPTVHLKPKNTSLLVEWSPPSGRIQLYQVTCQAKDQQRDNANRTKQTPKTSCTFFNLTPYTEYKITVSALNEEYWSRTRTAYVRTLEGVPFAPKNLAVKGVTIDRIALEWNAPEPEMGLITRYDIWWCEDGGMLEPYKKSCNATHYVIENLLPYTSYHVAVSAVNSIGVGPSANVTQETKLAVPDPPQLEIAGVTNTTLTVRWKISETYRGPDPTYELRWKRESEEESVAMTTIDEASREGKYTKTDLNPFTPYQVQIRALNDAVPGNWSQSVEAKTHIGIPSSPRHLKVQSKSSSHIGIAWDVPDPPNGIILRYWVKFTTGQSSKTYHTDTTNFSIKDLEPYTVYVFQVRAETEVGFGNYTEPLQVTTDIGVPSEPLNVSVMAKTSETVDLQWTTPERMNAPYVAYVIHWKKAEDLEEAEYSSEEDDSSFEEDEVNATTSYTISRLQPYTNYSVQVCAKTEAGIGNFTEPLLVQTMSGVPGIPNKVKAVNVKSTEMTITWDPPEVSRGPLEGYQLRWGVEGTGGSRYYTTKNSYRALGLRPYTGYFFEVSAAGEGGIGQPKWIIKRTNISTPSIPRHFEVVSVSDHCILLQWIAPENPNAPFVQYSVEWKEVTSSVVQFHDTNATSYRIRFLDPLTNYSIRISPRTAAGHGLSTEWLYVRTETKDVSTAVISGSVVGALVVVFLIGGTVLFVILRKKNAEQCKQSEKSPETPQITTCLQLEPLTDSKKIRVDYIDEYVLKLMSNNYYKLAQEFEQLGKESPAFPANEAKKNDNLNKNRWVKILPFDHSRVKLLPIGDELEPDYINASYVPGDSYLLEYIAAQGPLPNTVDDFWRIVWQESVFLIVMLTQCVERAKRNCEQYWPHPGTSAQYGAVEVRAVSENIAPTFTQRMFLVSQDGKQRHVTHMHYTKWPVSGCPKSPDDFLTFVQTVRSQVGGSTTGPLLVHCSAGIGRTGTLIAVDRISQQLSKKECDEVDIYDTVLEMRRYRPNLVQTEEQYYFIYLCVQRLIQLKRAITEEQYGGGIYAN